MPDAHIPSNPVAAPPPAAGRYRSLDDPGSLREFARNVGEGIYISDDTGRILDANPAMLELMGVASVEELRSYSEQQQVVHPVRRAEELALVRAHGSVREFELEVRRPDGARRTVLDTTYAVHDPDTGETFYHGILVDITSRKQLEEQLRELCIRDPLTGAYNRRYLLDLERQFAAHGTAEWGCIYMDVDHFKEINDRLGHHAGDETLARMARFLMRQVRAEEPVIRLGGDEFLIVLSGADESHTEVVARRLQLEAQRSAPVPFSFGWAARTDAEPFERTVNRADQQLLAVRVVERGPNHHRRAAEQMEPVTP